MTVSAQEALWLKAYALGVSTAKVLARADFSPHEAAKIQTLIARREAGEPLQYITGEADFYARDFIVGPGVLIPRHDTETLIQGVLQLFPRNKSFTFTDWGTGSGCIAITLLLEFPNAFAYMLEASTNAVEFARKNLQRYGLNGRAKLLSDPQDILTSELLISNPPYIPSGEIDSLMRDVRDFEPHYALNGGDDGMKCYREIVALSRQLLCSYLVLETGTAYQVQYLKTLCRDFTCCSEILDSGNFPRCLVFRRSDSYEVEAACR